MCGHLGFDKRIRSFLRAWGACALAFGLVAAWGAPAQAVILASGNGNTSAASLFTSGGFGSGAGGPGDPTAPGYGNVGRSSTGNASITYLSNGWAITADHVTISGSVSFGGTAYTVGETQHIGSTDLLMVHLSSANPYPSLPAITPAMIGSSTPSGQVIMIGNGVSTTGAQQYWTANETNPSNWVWTQNAGPPGSPGPDDYTGFAENTNHVIRWGQNTVATYTGMSGPFTDFLVNDGTHQTIAFTTLWGNQDGTGISSNPAQASNGDSGGPVFSFVGGQWVLSGMMIDISGLSNQPIEFFGDTTYMADLSQYQSQIAAIMATPEPASATLALLAASLLAVHAWRRRTAG